MTTETKFRIERVPGSPVTTEDLLTDIRRVAELAQTKIVTMVTYAEHGKYAGTTLRRRFGSWNKAIAAAGLEFASEQNYEDERLFENMMRVWEYYGRQPRLSEMARSPSTISGKPYQRRFRSWAKALEHFVASANLRQTSDSVPNSVATGDRRPRGLSLRLRFQVLKRDNFSCRACGASPALNPGLVLHVDHVIAWSQGGDTVNENLQTLCESCNLGKSNVF